MLLYSNIDINYDIMIKYLCKKNSIKKDQEIQEPWFPKEIPKLSRKSFSTQKSILNYATNFPNKFRELLTDKFYRYGVTTYDMEKNNVSFWASLLTMIDKNFLIIGFIITETIADQQQFDYQTESLVKENFVELSLGERRKVKKSKGSHAATTG